MESHPYTKTRGVGSVTTQLTPGAEPASSKSAGAPDPSPPTAAEFRPPPELRYRPVAQAFFACARYRCNIRHGHLIRQEAMPSCSSWAMAQQRTIISNDPGSWPALIGANLAVQLRSAAIVKSTVPLEAYFYARDTCTAAWFFPSSLPGSARSARFRARTRVHGHVGILWFHR